MSIGTALFVSLVAFVTLKVWTLTPDQYVAFIHSMRPRSYYDWPLFGAMARRYESHPGFMLWFARAWSIAAIPFAAFAIAALRIMFRHRKAVDL